MRLISPRRFRIPFSFSLTVLLACVVFTGAFTAPACNESDLEKIETQYNRTANSLNSAAKVNRSLYQAGKITLDQRRQVASLIGRVNGVLEKAVDRTYLIKPDDAGSVKLGKEEVTALLQGAVNDLNSLNVVNAELNLVIQASIAAVNEAIGLVRRMKEVS